MRKLLEPDTRLIGRPDGPAMADAVPADRVDGRPPQLSDALVASLGRDRVFDRLTDFVRYPSNASPYRYTPSCVVAPRTPRRWLACCNVIVMPRQRIVLRREIARQPCGSQVLSRPQHDYEYDAIQTSAGDGI